MNETNLLIVDDDAILITFLTQVLSELGTVRFATRGEDALRMAKETPPDLVLMDIQLPGMSGFAACAAMKDDPQLRDVPVIFMTGQFDVETEVRGLSMGAVDFISKPLRGLQVIARVKLHLRLKRMSDALRHSASTDPLTSLANRRRFEETLETELTRSQRHGSPLSLLMVDVDYFKAYNDHYGHPNGDRCLVQIADALGKSAFRPADLAARHGGEEFVILLPETNIVGARIVALRLLSIVEALQLPHSASPVAGHVTVSIGGATLEGGLPQSRSAIDLIASADQALYSAKRQGRRRVHFSALSTELNPVPALQAVHD